MRLRDNWRARVKVGREENAGNWMRAWNPIRVLQPLCRFLRSPIKFGQRVLGAVCLVAPGCLLESTGGRSAARPLRAPAPLRSLTLCIHFVCSLCPLLFRLHSRLSSCRMEYDRPSMFGFHLRTQSPSAVLILALLLIHLSPPVMGGCLVNHCMLEYSRNLRRDKVVVGRNLRYCSLLNRYDSCLWQTSRMCRGELKFHTARTLVIKYKARFQCSALLQKAKKTKMKNIDSTCLFPYQKQKGDSGHRVCALFGDPHLRTFDGQQETCQTEGAWPLVDNAFLGIQVTNRPVSDGFASRGTGITKVTVIVKAVNGCTEEKVLEANSESLPSAFVDGSRVTRTDSGGRPVLEVVPMTPGEHVEIRLRYIATRVSIRRHGTLLSLTLKIPEEIIRGSSSDSGQLCVSGCPSQERLPYKEFLASPAAFALQAGFAAPAFSRDAALRQCVDVGVVDFFLDACVFDLLISGDSTELRMARDALFDLRRFSPPYRRHYEANRTDLSIYDHLALPKSSERPRFSFASVLLFAVFVGLFFND